MAAFGSAEIEVEALPFIVLQLSNANWVKKLNQAISNGNTVIMENCPVDIDATLDPVLQRAIYKKGRSSYISFGGEEVEYDKNFVSFYKRSCKTPTINQKYSRVTH